MANTTVLTDKDQLIDVVAMAADADEEFAIAISNAVCAEPAGDGHAGDRCSTPSCAVRSLGPYRSSMDVGVAVATTARADPCMETGLMRLSRDFSPGLDLECRYHERLHDLLDRELLTHLRLTWDLVDSLQAAASICGSDGDSHDLREQVLRQLLDTYRLSAKEADRWCRYSCAVFGAMREPSEVSIREIWPFFAVTYLDTGGTADQRLDDYLDHGQGDS